jgi:hypothetical protein
MPDESVPLLTHRADATWSGLPLFRELPSHARPPSNSTDFATSSWM